MRSQKITPKACYRVFIRAKHYAHGRITTWCPIITADSAKEASERAIEIFGYLIDGDISVYDVWYRHDPEEAHPLKNSVDTQSRNDTGRFD